MIHAILLFLESIFLQTRATGNPFVDFWQRVINPNQPTAEGGAVIITPDYVPLFSVFVALFLIAIAVRYFAIARRQPNSEEPIGTVQFVIMGQGIMEMFVNKYNAPMRPSIVRALKSNDKFKNAINDILKLQKE